MKKSQGFTIIELLVVIAIIAILSGVILFSITQYINKSKDAAIQGALSSLIPTAEVYYDRNGINGYIDFCASGALTNANASVNLPSTNPCIGQICCKATTNAWVACAKEFTNQEKAFCVDSRGVKREICNTGCNDSITTCPPATIDCK